MTPRYMLDANVLKHIVNKHGNWRNAIKNLDLKHPDCCLSAVAYFELECAILGARLGKEKAQELADRVGRLKVEPYNRRAADAGAQLQVHLQRGGKGIGERDAMIAGHAKLLGCVMVTNNVSEFGRVHGLEIEDWIDP